MSVILLTDTITIPIISIEVLRFLHLLDLLSRVKDRFKLTQALVVDPLYLQHSYSESAIDYRVRISKPAKAW